MPLTVQQPFGRDVTKKNPIEFIYLKGDADTDGSLRLLPDTGSGANFEFQIRATGVWNDTGIQIAASTVFLGRDLEVKGAGDWILTTDIQADHKALIPHIEFSEAEGSKQSAHVPILSPLQEGVPIQPDFSQEIIASSYTVIQVTPAEILTKRVRYKTGSVPATQPLNISFSRPVGTVFWSRNYPSSRFAAGLDVTIELLGLLEGFTGEPVTTTITSTAPFSLLGDSSGGIYTLLDFYFLNQEDVITSTVGMDRVLIDCLGVTIADISGNLILNGGLVG